MSDIDPSTLQAYRETEYRVHAVPAFTLRVDQASPDLLALQADRGVACSAFLTACNPLSQPLDDATNAAHQSRLADELSRRGLASLPGEGRHPSNGWPAEPSVLVVGVDLDTARGLGRQFGQNAILWCGPDAVPRLVTLR